LPHATQNSCIRESFVGNYRVDYDSGLLGPGAIEVDAWLRLPFLPSSPPHMHEN